MVYVPYILLVDTARNKGLRCCPALYVSYILLVDTALVDQDRIDNMIITRKIEIFVCESDKDLKGRYIEKLYDNRNAAVKTANMCASHLFALDNTMPYISDEDKEKITFLGTTGKTVTRQNAPYVAASIAFKGKADMGMLSCVIQNVRKNYQEDRKGGGMWDKSLRSYKGDMPIPFKPGRFANLRVAEYTSSDGTKKKGGFFTLMGIPFQMRFGRDRSNNKAIVERVIKGEYKMATSSIQIKDRKTFLLICVDIPKKENSLMKGKKLFAFLGVLNPILCFCSETDDYDAGKVKIMEIGTKEEFNYRRRQIQEAARRCQTECKYSNGGKGRKRKTAAIERFKEKEYHYVDTKLHTYSKMLIDYAVKNGCGEIVLLNQLHREEKANDDNMEGDNFVLRNWSYSGLKNKIEYKAKMNNITVTVKQ